MSAPHGDELDRSTNLVAIKGEGGTGCSLGRRWQYPWLKIDGAVSCWLWDGGTNSLHHRSNSNMGHHYSNLLVSHTRLSSRWCFHPFLLAFLWALVLPSPGLAAMGKLASCSEIEHSSAWVSLDETQEGQAPNLTELPVVVGPSITDCEPVVLPSSGLDWITESQWALVIQAVVDESGAVDRFRILNQPRLGVDLLQPFTEALPSWRFEPLEENGKPIPSCVLFVLTKRMGRWTLECPHEQ